MSKRLNIGLVLSALPGYSETFIKNKINCLVENDFKVSLFIAGKVKPNERLHPRL